MDGKPHAGPFVDYEDRKKTRPDDTTLGAVDATLASKDTLDDMLDADGVKIPKTNDGVMGDPGRVSPKIGTTGTEGGVSEKDKARKAYEGQTGEKAEKKPDSPKVAPPLPHSEQTKIEKEADGIKKSKTKSKDADPTDSDDAEGLAGIEVCC